MAQDSRALFWEIDRQLRTLSSCVPCDYLPHYFSRHPHEELSKMLVSHHLDLPAIVESANGLSGKEFMDAQNDLIFVKIQVPRAELSHFLLRAIGDVIRVS